MTRVRGAAVAVVLLLVLPMMAVTSSASATAGSYRFFATQGGSGEPVRWNPCRAITYKINTNGLARRADVRRVRAAVAEASAASGIPFRYLGRTSFVPDDRTAPVPARIGADLVIAWARAGSGPRRSALLLPRKPRQAGAGGYGVVRTNKGFRIARSGFLVFDAGHIFRMTARKKYVVALHELGHVLGLDHVGDRGQVMHGTVLDRGPTHYAAGDRRGLRRVGRSAGCLAAPGTPAPPAVRQDGNDFRITTAPVTSRSGAVTYVLSSPELGGRLAASSTPRFTVPVQRLLPWGRVGSRITFTVRAVNRVAWSASAPTAYRAPAAVISAAPRLVATPSTFDLVRPRAVLAGTTIDVSQVLGVSTSGVVTAHKVDGGSYASSRFAEHYLFFGSSVTRFDVVGAVSVVGGGLQRTFDMTGSYLTGAVPQPQPEPTPEPTP